LKIDDASSERSAEVSLFRLESAPPSSAKRPAFSRSAQVAWTRRAAILALILAWEAWARLGADPQLFAPPSLILRALFTQILSDPAVRAAIGLTLFEIAAAYAIAVVAGVAIGLAIGWTGFGRRSLSPIVLLLYSIPQIVFLPLFTLVFGIGPAAKIAFGVSHGVFPVVVNVIAGMRTVNPIYLRSARSMGARPAAIARDVILPHMAPSLFAGLRLAMTMTMLGVVLAELYVSTAGVGYYTKLFADTFDPSPLFALVGTLAVIAIALNELVRVAERRFTRWKS
jgi:ABC-type nitrate/sulfonate/bicarbonate transport system permease component